MTDLQIRILGHLDRLRVAHPCGRVVLVTHDPEVASRADRKIVLKDGRIVAFASYNATGFPNCFSPTGTAEQHRRAGLGRVLFYHCMRDLRELGHTHAEICWVGPVVYYAKIAGATIGRVFYWFEKEL